MPSPVAILRKLCCLALPIAVWLPVGSAAAQDAGVTIERVKGSIVAVGTLERSRTPPFEFRGTGFVVGDGTLVVTNAHVLPGVLDTTKLEALGILIPSGRPRQGAVSRGQTGRGGSRIGLGGVEDRWRGAASVVDSRFR